MNVRACAATIALLGLFVPQAARSQTPIRFSGALGLSLPIGDLGDASEVGFNLDVRGEGKLRSPGWSFRGDLSWDRFGGRGPVASYSYAALAGNLQHHNATGRVYEFGGLGLYASHVALRNDVNSDDTNLGLQLGVGVDLKAVDPAAFLEFGLTNVFTSGSNSLWFPVRFGLRF